MEEPAPLSLELRTIKKRQRNRVGGICLAVGILACGASIAAFLQPGATLIAIYALIAGLALAGVGIYMLRKAATHRW